MSEQKRKGLVASEASGNPNKKGPLEVVLGLFADVRPGEAPIALLLTLNVFLLLTAYYLLKVAREPLILMGGGAEVKSYASVGQSLLLIPATAAYSWLASKVGRVALALWLTVFFVGSLLLFWVLGERGVPLGIPFFLWVGIFNLSSIAQFWSFAADLYTDADGKRIFPIIGIGSSVGAVAGAWIADLLFKMLKVGPYTLMVVAAGLLGVCFALTVLVDRIVGRSLGSKGKKKEEEEAPLSGANGYALVFRDKYLLLFAAMLFVLNCVTKTGDYVFDVKILQQADQIGGDASIFIGQYKAHYFEWVNGVGVAMQLFLVSRIIKHLGLRATLLIMPVVSFIGYGATFMIPVIGVLFWARTCESSLDYSLSNTTRQALWLPTSRDAKYKAKQVIDSLFVRAGDASSAGVVWIGVHLALQARTFIAINLVFSAVWLVVAIALGRAYAEKEEKLPEAERKAAGLT